MSLALSLDDAVTLIGRNDLRKIAAANPETASFADRDATLLSFVQAIIKNASADTIADCRAHARFWGITAECEAAQKKIAAYKPGPGTAKKYAMSESWRDTLVQKYAMDDADATSQAATDFYEDRTKFPVAWRKNASVRLLARGEQLGVAFPDYINQYLHKAAGYGYLSLPALEDAYVQRANLVTPDDEADLQKLGSIVEAINGNSELRNDPTFVSSAIDVFALYDTAKGLTSKYGSALALPEEIIDDRMTLPSLMKAASVHPLCRLVNGVELDLARVTPDVLNVIDPSLSKMARAELCEVLPTLPKGDADLLVRLASKTANEMGTAGEDSDAFFAETSSPTMSTVQETGDQSPLLDETGGQALNGVLGSSGPELTGAMDMPVMPTETSNENIDRPETVVGVKSAADPNALTDDNFAVESTKLEEPVAETVATPAANALSQTQFYVPEKPAAKPIPGVAGIAPAKVVAPQTQNIPNAAASAGNTMADVNSANLRRMGMAYKDPTAYGTGK